MTSITRLEPHQVLVIGTNAAGIHAGGAAAQAHRDFGAFLGQSQGAIGGQSYGIVTLDFDMQKVPLDSIAYQSDDLRVCALANPDREFLLTPIGTGIAGFTIDEIKPFFDNLPDNIRKVGNWGTEL